MLLIDTSFEFERTRVQGHCKNISEGEPDQCKVKRKMQYYVQIGLPECQRLFGGGDRVAVHCRGNPQHVELGEEAFYGAGGWFEGS